LRFYSDATLSPLIPIDLLAVVSREIMNLISNLSHWEILDLKAKGRLMLAAPPRQGCLEILVVPEITSAGFAVPMGAASDLTQLVYEGIKENIEVAAFLWTLAFGGRGVVEAWNRKTSKVPQAIETPTPDRRSEIELILSHKAVTSQAVVESLRRLIDAASATGADRVTIQIPDNPEIDIYSKTSRRRRGLIAQHAKLGVPTAQHLQIHALHRENSPEIEVVLGSTRHLGFTAQLDHKRVFIVWMSKKTPPLYGDVEVRGFFLEPSLLDPLSEVTPDMEEVEAAFAVEGVVTVE